MFENLHKLKKVPAMKLEILEIQNKGNQTKEYILLKAKEDCELSDYAVADTSYTGDNEASNKVRHFHWFMDKQLKEGDRVYLYTGTGREKTDTNKDGTKVHHLFWGLKIAVWNDEGDAAVLFEIKEWDFMRVKS